MMKRGVMFIVSASRDTNPRSTALYDITETFEPKAFWRSTCGVQQLPYAASTTTMSCAHCFAHGPENLLLA